MKRSRDLCLRGIDFTKVTPDERIKIDEAEKSGFISEDEIDWDNLEKYAN